MAVKVKNGKLERFFIAVVVAAHKNHWKLECVHWFGQHGEPNVDDDESGFPMCMYVCALCMWPDQNLLKF